MNEALVEIRYDGMKPSLSRVLSTVTSFEKRLYILCSIFMLLCCALIFAVLRHDSSFMAHQYLLTCASLCTLTAAFCAAVRAGYLASDKTMLSLGTRLEVTPQGIRFPGCFKESLGGLLDRRWSDLKSIACEWHGSYPFVPGDKIVLLFASGESASVSLASLPVDGVVPLLLSIELHAPCEQRGVLELRSFIDEKQISGNAGDSYTRIWEQELQQRLHRARFVPLTPGTMLRGRFRIIAQHALGGFAATYLAEDASRKLAIVKEAVPPPCQDDYVVEKAKEMFEREGTILQRLCHPRIVSVQDCFEENGRSYLILEHIPGKTLRQRIMESGLLSESDTLEWLSAISDILVYLHSQVPPVLHRDLTPENLVVGADNRLTLIDFGASNEFLSNATATFVGKQAYVAPEQLKGKACPVSDIYAAGCTAFYMLTGNDPTPLSTSHPRSIRSELSHAIDELVSRATAVDLSQRFNSAQELRGAIETMCSRS